MTQLETSATPLRVPAILHDRSPAPLWMEGVATLWFISTFAIFPGNAFLLYPLAAVFIAILYFEARRIIPVLAKCWFLFLIPIMVILSFIWSPYSGDAIRYGMFFVLSALSMVIIGTMLTERQILRSIFLCAVAGTALAVTEIGAIMATGVSEYLGQKNFFAVKMMIGMVMAYAVLANKEEHLILRLLALLILPIDFALVVAANSATALILAIVAMLMLIFGQIFWVNSRGVPGLRPLIAGVAIALGLSIVLLALSLFGNTSVEDLLAALGKDSTFTGRTALWEQARRTSAEHPILGVGAGGFWQYDVGAAQTLVENDNKAPGTVLGFHSSYLETQVHLGYVGLSLLILFIGITLWKVTKSFLVDGSLERTCFFVGALIVFSMSFTESLLFAFFQPGIYVFTLAVVTVIASASRKRRVIVNLVPEKDPVSNSGDVQLA